MPYRPAVSEEEKLAPYGGEGEVESRRVNVPESSQEATLEGYDCCTFWLLWLKAKRPAFSLAEFLLGFWLPGSELARSSFARLCFGEGDVEEARFSRSSSFFFNFLPGKC